MKTETGNYWDIQEVFTPSDSVGVDIRDVSIQMRAEDFELLKKLSNSLGQTHRGTIGKALRFYEHTRQMML
jgi:hypothetical protein